MITQEIQKKIYASALAVYKKNGKEETSLEKIAQHAQLNINLLKEHYKNESEIYIELFEEHFEHILHRYEPSHVFDDIDLYFKNIIEACKFYNDDDLFYSLYIDFFSENVKKEQYRSNMIMVFESTSQVIAMQLEHFKELGLLKKDINIRVVARGIVAAIDGMEWHRGVFGVNNELYEQMLEETLMNIASGIKAS